MGETLVKLRIRGPAGVADVEALADTGATFTKVPRTGIESAGIQGSYEANVELANGNVITRRLGLADVDIDGVRRLVLVSFGEEERVLLGYTTLETLGFNVNPVTRLLEPTPAIEY